MRFNKLYQTDFLEIRCACPTLFDALQVKGFTKKRGRKKVNPQQFLFWQNVALYLDLIYEIEL